MLRNVRRHPSHICFQRAVDIHCLAMFFCQYDPSVAYLCQTYIPYYEIFLCHTTIYLLRTATPETVRHLRQNGFYFVCNSTVSNACTPHSRQSTSRQKYVIRAIPSDIGTARYWRVRRITGSLCTRVCDDVYLKTSHLPSGFLRSQLQRPTKQYITLQLTTLCCIH